MIIEIAKKTFKIVPLFLSLVFLCFAQEDEKITVTTYYPSPYGVYDRMKTNEFVIGDINDAAPEEGVVRFKSLEEGGAGKKGDLYFDSDDNKFKYYDGKNWRFLGGSESNECAWFRTFAGCPEGWKYQDDIEINEMPTTWPRIKQMWYHKHPSSSSACIPGHGVAFGCNSTKIAIYPGVYNKEAACKRCFGDVGFLNTEELPATTGCVDKCGASWGCVHYRCVYEEESATAPLAVTYKLYYCCL